MAYSLVFYFLHIDSWHFVYFFFILIINFATEVPSYIVMHFSLGNSIFRMTIVEVASTACAPYSYERDWIYVGVHCQIWCISNSSSGLHYFLFFPDIISHREAMSFLFISSSAPTRKHALLWLSAQCHMSSFTHYSNQVLLGALWLSLAHDFYSSTCKTS